MPLRLLSAVCSAVALAVVAPAALAADSGDTTLSSRLQMLAGKDLRSASPAEQADAVSLLNRGAGSLMRDDGALVVEIELAGSPDAATGALRDAGAEIIHVSAEYRTVTASVDESELRQVGAVAGVESVQEVITPMTGRVGTGGGEGGAINTCVPGVVSEGDTQLKAATARTQFDVDGTGVKVGVLSDSFARRNDLATTAAQDVASGDLPGPGNPCGRTNPVQVLDDSAPDPPTSATVGDEGRAMAQIVHDLAPGADLSFATAFTGQTGFADNIKALATAGADVIVDDIIYFAEPFYQDGIVANAVRDVTDQGVAYFSMAFNNNGLGVNSYEAPAYRSTTCPAVVAALPGADDCMDFDPGAGTDNMFDINVNSGSVRFSFNWAEAQEAVGTDLDFHVLNTSGTAISFSATDNNLTTQEAFEFLGGTFGSSGARQIVIQRFSGAGTPRLKWVNNDNGANRITSTQAVSAPDVQGPTIYGHNGTATAQTVGAVPFSNANTVESFSSRGPVTHLFGPVQPVGAAAALPQPEVLSKPNVAATDGGINTFFGPGNRFFGTSAAAPHAAALGALQLEANPGMPQAQLKSDQRVTAVPVGAFGAFAVGDGLVQAGELLSAATTPFPTVTITGGSGPINDPTGPIEFTATGDSLSFTCAVDGGAPGACSSPFTLPTPLGDGAHTVQVTATDRFLHSGSATANPDVDTKKPKLKIKKSPKKKTAKKKAKFKFKVESGATLECKLDKQRFKRCKKSAKFKVEPGKHKLIVRATDAAGNSTRLTYKWTVIG